MKEKAVGIIHCVSCQLFENNGCSGYKQADMGRKGEMHCFLFSVCFFQHIMRKRHGAGDLCDSASSETLGQPAVIINKAASPNDTLNWKQFCRGANKRATASMRYRCILHHYCGRGLRWDHLVHHLGYNKLLLHLKKKKNGEQMHHRCILFAEDF